MISTSLAVSIIGITCGFAFGLLVRSDAEVHSVVSSGRPYGFMLFGSGSFPQLLASGIVNAILSVLLFLGPSLLLLNAFNLTPLSGNDYYVWIFSLLGGTGIGKLFRWWRWKNSRDFA